jgi:hypothetical protein
MWTSNPDRIEQGEMRNDEIQHTVLIKERKHHQLHADTIQHAVTLKVLTTQLALCDGVESERIIIESDRSSSFSGTRLLSSVSLLELTIQSTESDG